MTSVNCFQGKGDKNSSKVLAPPGGKSNDIFGFANEPADPPPQRRQKATQPPPFAQHTYDQGPAKPCKPVSSFNPLTGEPYGASPNQQPARSDPQPPPQQQPQQQQRSNTAGRQQTQAQSSSPPQHAAGTSSGEPTHTSIKIYNPPGGKSSISF
ncbi:uncharacterized protein [Diadema antillarum]|uniref:uncharacterized protein n=1 Tax=Diadema antillarum TaxID=105358 RepID=UPI003A8A39A1